MSKKTSKNLDSEYSNLKNLFVDMQEKFKALKKSNVFRCDECEETFTTLTDLGKHRKSHQPSIWSYPCDDCEKCSMRNGSLMPTPKNIQNTDVRFVRKLLNMKMQKLSTPR